jgi:hypothetical protein
MTIQEAIFNLNPSVVTVFGTTAYDVNGKEISYNLEDAENAMKVGNCKEQAQSLLSATDWIEVPSVTNTANTPHLANASDFVAYRNSIRQLAVNPVANPIFPTKPTELWA